MLKTILRLLLYVLAGITTALLGWNLGQLTNYLLAGLENISFLTPITQVRQWEEIILFPFVTVCLASGMVLNEIFITTPTRPKLNWRIARLPMLYAIPIGLLAGLGIGAFLQILYLPQFQIEEKTVRVFSWWCIGAVVGLIEGLTWQFYSKEGSNPKRRQRRQLVSFFAASFASVIAAGIFEGVRAFVNNTSDSFQKIEDPLGLCFLGAILGIAFAFTTSPSYTAALRAGRGFEYRGEIEKNKTKVFDRTYSTSKLTPEPKPAISSRVVQDLQFVSEEEESDIEEGLFIIEEGLSIQLPETGKVIVGGTRKQEKNGTVVGSDIYLPDTEAFLAQIEIINREAKLIPAKKSYEKIEINGIPLDSSRAIPLKHNTLIAFLTDLPDPFYPDSLKMYRFVYYNRFLDPEG